MATEVLETSSKQPGEGSDSEQRGRKKKQRLASTVSGSGSAGGTVDGDDMVEVAATDFVRILPIRKPKATPPPKLELGDKAPQLVLSADKLEVSGTKGYRTARASHGAYVGTWYCEVTVTHLGESGHVRLGWATRRAELQAPVGYDAHGFSYRDLEGSKVHRGLREPYGEPYGEGDVIGLYIHLPEGGRPLEPATGTLVRYKGGVYRMAQGEAPPTDMCGAAIAFTRNGRLQGVAYTNVVEGTYYPAASMYTLPSQERPASVRFSFGPEFRYAPPVVEGYPAARPVCELAGLLDGMPAAKAVGTMSGGAGAAAGGIGGVDGNSGGAAAELGSGVEEARAGVSSGGGSGDAAAASGGDEPMGPPYMLTNGGGSVGVMPKAAAAADVTSSHAGHGQAAAASASAASAAAGPHTSTAAPDGVASAAAVPGGAATAAETLEPVDAVGARAEPMLVDGAGD